VDRDPAALQRAIELGVIDTAAESVSERRAARTWSVVAVPVRAIGPVLHDVALAMDARRPWSPTSAAPRPRSVRTPARSCAPVPALRRRPPIAGREASGVDAATADLFKGARVVLAAEPGHRSGRAGTVRGAWEAIGSRVSLLAAADHDRIFAAVSHLPHLLSFALVSEIAERANAAELFGFAAGGFRDFTRIAASSPEMWRDIALQNRVGAAGGARPLRCAPCRSSAS
jgi:prephenate dehydrogenase